MKHRRFREALRFAVAGIVYAVSRERNMRIHLAAATAALFGGMWLGLNRIEFMILLFVITLVLVAEMFNTAVEATVNAAAPTYNPWAKIAKDVAAGAVLVTAVLAIVIAVMLIWGKITGR